MASRGGKQYVKNKKTTIEQNIHKFGLPTCELCKKAPLVINPAGQTSNFPNSLTIDHIIPITKGGTHRLTNLKVTCYACNSKKANS